MSGKRTAAGREGSVLEPAANKRAKGDPETGASAGVANPAANDAEKPNLANSRERESDVACVAAAHLEPLGLALGGRIEVKWQLHEGTEGQAEKTTDRWWPAVVDSIKTRTDASGRVICEMGSDVKAAPPSASGAPLLRLRYEPFKDFEEETRSVVLLKKGVLWDAEDQAQMLWKAPEDPEPPEEEDTIGLSELVAEVGHSAEEEDAAMKAALEEMPRGQAIEMANGYAKLSSVLMSGLRQLAETGQQVVTETDIKGIFSTLLPGRR